MENTSSVAVGSPLVHVLNGQETGGYVVAIKADQSKRYIFSEAGLVPTGREMVVVWRDLTIATMDEIILAELNDNARSKNILPITNDQARTLYVQALERSSPVEEKVEVDAREVPAKCKLDEEARASFVLEADRRVPRDSKSAIIAELNEVVSPPDETPPRIKKSRVIILAFSRHCRDLFSEMRKAGESVDELEHVAGWRENRDKSILGSSYLSEKGDGRNGGWVIRKVKMGGDDDSRQSRLNKIPLGEWTHNTMPKSPRPLKPFNMLSGSDGQSAHIRPQVKEGKRPGFSEIKFREKPDEEVRDQLKQNGFRWSRTNEVWYGPTAVLSKFLTM